ncbi:MAG: M28 family peptidase [Planctomycetota bacterium]
MLHPRLAGRCALSALLFTLPLGAQGLVENDPEAAPLRRLLDELGPDVQQFNEHVVTLANPFMEGRVPGSRGMAIARDYFEFYMEAAGVLPPFTDAEGNPSFRQAFPLRGSVEVTEQSLRLGDEQFAENSEFTTLGLSGSASIQAPIAFCGYGIDEGPDGYSSFGDGESLDGKIAMVFRYEPMNAEGESLWSTGRRPWSRNSNLTTKVRNVIDRGAVGVILINPPGCADPRAARIMAKGAGGRTMDESVPVIHVSNDAAARLVALLSNDSTSLAAMREAADQGGSTSSFDAEATIAAKLEQQEILAENVGGVVAGRGEMKDEWIVIGAHLDHLGVGLYGARDRSRIGKIHPGADDNASGSAAVLMLAESLREAYEQLPEDASARSILLVGFDAEEAGLHGSRYYVENPIAPIEDHALMINFDMIGRIVNKRLSVSGTTSATGMIDWLDPIFEASPIDVAKDINGPGGSDHIPFMSKGVPWLFAIIKDFHNDYHTPDDVTSKINNVDAVHTIYLFHKIAFAAAQQPGRFQFQGPDRGR